MKKLIAVTGVALAAGVWVAYFANPTEVARAGDAVARIAEKLWNSIEANPAPVLVALGTFVLTIAYHKLRGKSFRESVEVAATRVTVVPLPAPAGGAEPPVVARAKARATRAQLIADQIALENRIRKLPGEVRTAEKEACYTEQALDDTRRALEAKHAAHADAVAKLDALRAELAAGEVELAAICDELKKLAEVV